MHWLIGGGGGGGGREMGRGEGGRGGSHGIWSFVTLFPILAMCMCICL